MLGSVEEITYRYVRWLMIVLPAFLLAVVVATAAYKRGFETSISAYYGGPVRDVLVGTLVATAACLIAYQGVGLLEDYALNGAGFYAVFVALVPTGFSEIMEDLRNTPSPDDMTAAEYGFFLRIALTGVVLLGLGLLAREVRSGSLGQLITANVDKRSKILTRIFVAATAVVLAWFVVMAMVQLWSGPSDQIRMQGFTIRGFTFSIHLIAAVMLICSLCVVVSTNTWPFFQLDFSKWNSKPVKYLAILLLMVPGALVPVLISHLWAPEHLVILLECWELALFILYWLLENNSLGDGGVSPDLKGPLVEPKKI